MKSVYQKNFMATAVMVLICCLVLMLSFMSVGKTYVVTECSENMENAALEAARVTSATANPDVGIDQASNYWVCGMIVSTISNATSDRVMMCDREGRVFICSDQRTDCDHIGQTLTADEIKTISENGSMNEVKRLGGLFSGKQVIVAVPVTSGSGDKTCGYVIATKDVDTLVGAWQNFVYVAIFITMLVFLISISVSLAYSKRMAQPLDEIAAASRKFARGDFSVRVRQQEDTSDEMGALIDSFNKMADSLESAEERRSEFIANISHELRTPMTTISGFADGILDGTISKDDEDKYLRSIRDETRRLSRLVRDMLDVSRMKASTADPSKRTVFDMTELVLQTLLSFETRANEKHLDVDPQLPENSLMVRAEKDAITQVIYNLLDNAIKFAHENTCITLRLYKDGNKAYFSIKDCGETIPPDDLPFIFDRFHKSDRSRSLDKTGVGLGLYLVKTIINNHDEDIVVKSENGVTEFVFTLALA